jgi:hypothetical protein
MMVVHNDVVTLDEKEERTMRTRIREKEMALDEKKKKKNQGRQGKKKRGEELGGTKEKKKSRFFKMRGSLG